MRIGLIGAGHVGSTLAYLCSEAGDEVFIANRHGPDTLRNLEAELGPKVHAATPEEAARFGDIVVLAVPFEQYRDLPAAELAGKTVVDACNYSRPRDGRFAELEDGRVTSSELVQRELRDAHVVKAFNAMRGDPLRSYRHSAGANRRYGIPVSADDQHAKRQVFDLVEQLGYEPVDAGGLAEGGRKHQPGSAVYTADLWADDLRDRIGVGG